MWCPSSRPSSLSSHVYEPARFGAFFAVTTSLRSSSCKYLQLSYYRQNFPQKILNLQQENFPLALLTGISIESNLSESIKRICNIAARQNPLATRKMFYKDFLVFFKNLPGFPHRTGTIERCCGCTGLFCPVRRVGSAFTIVVVAYGRC